MSGHHLLTAPRFRQPGFRQHAARTCGACAFWQPPRPGGGPGAREPGTCHRYAPAMPAGFPATMAGDWCGEHELAEAAADIIEAGDDA